MKNILSPVKSNEEEYCRVSIFEKLSWDQVVTHFFNRDLMCCYIQDTVLGSRNTVVNKTTVSVLLILILQ